MIVDLDLRGKSVLIVGGGREAERRARALLGEGCRVTVRSKSPSRQIAAWGKAKRLELVQSNVKDPKAVKYGGHHIVITATDDPAINRGVLSEARGRGTITYSSDDPEQSDYANPAVIEFGGVVKVAVFTGGQSPAMSRAIRDKAWEALKGVITDADIGHIRVQRAAREAARGTIPDQKGRRSYLQRVMRDPEIDQLIKDGELPKAKRRAIMILGEWR